MSFKNLFKKKDKKKFAHYKLDTAADCEKTLKEISYALFFLAGLQLFIGIFFRNYFLVDAACTAVIGGLLLWTKSRAAAYIFLVYGALTLLVTVMSALGIVDGGKNVILAALYLWYGVVAIRAANRLHEIRAKKTHSVK